MDFPKMLYRLSDEGAAVFNDDRLIACVVVDDAEEEALFASDGWQTADEINKPAKASKAKA